MNQIEIFSSRKLPNGAHFVFMSSVLKRAEGDAKVKQKAGELINKLKAAFEKEDEALQVSRKSLTTDDIVTADELRDKLYMSYKKAVRAYLGFPVPAQAQPAKVLWQHIQDYKIDPKMQLDKETGLMINLIDDLEKKYTTEVAALNLTGFVTQMKQANEQVRSLTEKRTDERTSVVVGALKMARANADEAYKDLVMMVNALAVVEKDEAYNPFIDYMNQEIKQMKQQVIGQAVAGKGKNADASKSGKTESGKSGKTDNSGSTGNPGKTGTGESGKDKETPTPTPPSSGALEPDV